MNYIPNILTIFRILASFFILIAPDSFFFYLYFFAGMTDTLDGWIARKMNWTSRFGTLLDSIADLIFFLVVVIKIVFTIQLPSFLLGGSWRHCPHSLSDIRHWFLPFSPIRQFAYLSK